MTFKVHITARAVVELERIHDELSAYSAAVADRTVDLIKQSILEISQFPRPYVLAPEAESATIERRHMVVGNHRVLYTIQDDAVRIYTIVHTSQRSVNPKDFT